MANSFSPLELVSDRLNTIHTAIDALFKHTTKAVDIRTQAGRTTGWTFYFLVFSGINRISRTHHFR